MNAISEKSFTRITLGLDIVRKILSGPYKGYHELSIIKHRIGLYDTISVEESQSTRIVCNDPFVPIDKKNLCWKALEAIKNAYSIDKNVTITIEKKIPVKGGLAGGSANASTMLILLNKLWDLGLDADRMIEIGRRLGMDVPYFFSGNTAFDSEAGGTLTPLSTSCRFDFILVVPHFGVSTPEAYAAIDYTQIGKNIAATSFMKDSLKKNNPQGVIDSIHNDFELTVFKRYPELGVIKQRLLDLGCPNAAMTGSGSTVMGIIKGNNDVEKIKAKIGYPSIITKSL
jgi:4-diphosphocytidyl-2-C-methyl-D-erythritol kinase